MHFHQAILIPVWAIIYILCLAKDIPNISRVFKVYITMHMFPLIQDIPNNKCVVQFCALLRYRTFTGLWIVWTLQDFHASSFWLYFDDIIHFDFQKINLYSSYVTELCRKNTQSHWTIWATFCLCENENRIWSTIHVYTLKTLMLSL